MLFVLPRLLCNRLRESIVSFCMDYTDFIHNITWKDLPEEVKAQSILCVRDILATAAGASTLPNSEKIRSLVAEQYGVGKCLLWFQSVRTSITGAAFGNAFLVDSLDGLLHILV